jgi:hypothetical protein
MLSLLRPWPALNLSMIPKVDNTSEMVILPVSCNLKGGMKNFLPTQVMAPVASGISGALSNGMDLMIICCSYFRFF